MNVCIIHGIDTQLKSICLFVLRLLTKKSIDIAFGGSWADADVDMAVNFCSNWKKDHFTMEMDSINII